MSIELNGTTGVSLVQDNALLFTPKNNWIINGQFDVWQRGTSQTSAGYGSDDRWLNWHNGASSKTNSRQSFTVGQTDVPSNPTFYSRTVIASGGGSTDGVWKTQSIEDVTKLANKTITLSFWAKANATKNLTTEFYQDFGTGGSAVVILEPQKVLLTTSWKRFVRTILLPSISGKTIGANNATVLRFWLDAGSAYNANTDSLGNQSGTFDIANVCLVEGSVPVECPNEPYGEVLRKCQRYYYRASSANGSYARLSQFSPATSAGVCYVHIQLPVVGRIAPGSVEYSSALKLMDGTNFMAVTSMNIDMFSGLILSLTVLSSGLTQYRPYALSPLNDTSQYIGIPMEL